VQIKNHRMKFLIAASSILVLLSASCKKHNDSSNPGTTSGTLVRIQQGTDADITNDTVYLIKYNSANKIASIVDSLNLDTLTATYDATSGKLSSVNSTWGIKATYIFDASGLLTQLSYTGGSDIERFTFEYTNGVISKKNYYSNLGSGPLTLLDYYTYTVSGGNISSESKYAANGSLQLTSTYTYSSQSNSFKDLCLFNYSGTLGSDNIIDVDTYFNTNLRATISENGSSSANNTYTTGSSQQVTKAVSKDVVYGDVFTWMFTYK
jgi:hypothetical protein